MFRKKNKPAPRGRIDYSQYSISKDLRTNLTQMQEVFAGDDTLNVRELCNRENPELRYLVLFLGGMTNPEVTNNNILRPLIESRGVSTRCTAAELLRSVLPGNTAKLHQTWEELVQGLLSGDSVVFVKGDTEAITADTKGFPFRAITEPDDERALRGPREGFTELMMNNLTQVRRKLQTSDLKFKFRTAGTRSRTRICLAYLDSVVNHDAVKDLEARLDRLAMDGALDVEFIAERIRDYRFSLFKTMGSTEKPDIVAGKLLEGRVALFVDGTPQVLTVPFMFIENFQASDDYYLPFEYSSFSRLLRFIAFALSVSIPAVYVALVTFHIEMLDRDMLMSIITASKGVPFTTVLECALMLLVFDILHEAGVRMPNKVGQALSIVGALVVGQAAVEAKIFSAPMVIIVALAGITGLMVPRLRGAVIILRLLALISVSVMGLYGFYFFLICIVLYLAGLRSFGVVYLSHMLSLKPSDLQDTYVRFPYAFMRKRPSSLSNNSVRDTTKQP